MSTNLSRIFGQGGNLQTSAPTGTRADLIPAKVWMNVGYIVQVQVADAETKEATIEDRFVSLPIGIAIDTMQPIDVAKKAKTDVMANLFTKQNDLLELIQNTANDLKPGETAILAADETTGLCIQLRRVKEESVPVADAENPFATDKLNLKARMAPAS